MHRSLTVDMALITYQTDGFLRNKADSLAEHQYTALLVAHELAHHYVLAFTQLTVSLGI